MKIQFFAVFDAVAERYVDPFPAQNAGIALRGFEEACKTEGHAFAKHAEDYSLWLVGAFDPELGIMTGSTPVKIAMATSFVSGPIGPEQEFQKLQVDYEHDLARKAAMQELADDENGKIKEIG